MAMAPDAVFRIGTTTVAVVALELLEAPTPAIVIASNNWLQPEPGSLASDVMTRAGEAYAADLRAAVAQAPEEGIPPGAAVPIRGYDLAEGDARQAILHVITTSYPRRASFEGRIASTPQVIYAAVRNAVAMGVQMEARAVSLSMMGLRAGSATEAPPVMAAAFARGLADHLAPGVNLDAILVCETDDRRRALACEAIAAVVRASELATDNENRPTATASSEIANNGHVDGDDRAEDIDQAGSSDATSPPVRWISRAEIEASEEVYGWPLPDFLPVVATGEAGLGLPTSALQAITLIAATAPAPMAGGPPPDGIIWNPSTAVRFLQFGCGWLVDAAETARTERDAPRALAILHLLVQVSRQWVEAEPLNVHALVQLASAFLDASQVIQMVDPAQAISTAYRGLPAARGAVALDGDNPHACLVMGRYAVLFNQPDAARASLGRVIDLSPESPQALQAADLLETIAPSRPVE
jgi:O-acetyl-ADP-ribose deacetylase (regulator of RNase III)